MKIHYLDQEALEPIGEKIVTREYLAFDSVVADYNHIINVIFEEKFSFLDTIQISQGEYREDITTTFIFNIGKALTNHFNISLFLEKLSDDVDSMAALLNLDWFEFHDPDDPLPNKSGGIFCDIIGPEYGMAFIKISSHKDDQQSLGCLIEIGRKLDHYFFILLKDIKKAGKGILPLIPSYAYERKKIKVFICHSSKDKEFARKIRDSLQAEAMETWFDEDDILVGDDFIERMENGLTDSDFIVIILSPNFLSGPWAKKEYRTALTEQIHCGMVKILPIKHKATEVPVMLNSISHADFSENFDSGFKQLRRSIVTRYYQERRKKEDIAKEDPI